MTMKFCRVEPLYAFRTDAARSVDSAGKSCRRWFRRNELERLLKNSCKYRSHTDRWYFWPGLDVGKSGRRLRIEEASAFAASETRRELW